MSAEDPLNLLLGLVLAALNNPVYLVIVAVIVVLWRLLRRRGRDLDSDYPAQLEGAQLVMSEQDIFTDVPVPLAGRPDEVYRQRHGSLIPVETKTRNQARVHHEDLIQLSVYRVLLQHSTHKDLPGRPGRAVADYGFVRIVTPSGVRWRAVKLMPEAQVVWLHERRIALEERRIRPTSAKHPALCRRCSYRTQCQARRV